MIDPATLTEWAAYCESSEHLTMLTKYGRLLMCLGCARAFAREREERMRERCAELIRTFGMTSRKVQQIAEGIRALEETP